MKCFSETFKYFRIISNAHQRISSPDLITFRMLKNQTEEESRHTEKKGGESKRERFEPSMNNTEMLSRCAAEHAENEFWRETNA